MKRVSTDLLVAGGGVAGTLAAVAAARSGVRTLLVEREAGLGGTGHAGLLRQVCGLYLNGEAYPSDTLNGGITREVAAFLGSGTPGKIRKIGRVHVLPCAGGVLRKALAALCDAEKMLTVRCGSAVASVETEGGRTVRSATVEGTGDRVAVAAQAFVDCTGTGEVAVLAGAGYALSPENERQMAGFVIRLTGLSDPDGTLPFKVPYLCARAAQRGLLPPLLRWTVYSPGDASGEGYCKLSVVGEDGPERDEKASKEGEALVAFLKASLPAFREAVVADTSRKALDREGRRILGMYTLTEDDVLSARKFPDGIAGCAWPIELWDRAKGTVYAYVPDGEHYEIPFRCLAVKGFTNLLAAGRCLSATRAAQGSARVMGTCMALGERAGLAAAHYVRHGDYPVDVRRTA
jgi:glycine/D-amino acid oxidase-like deaminating enzyme